MTKRSHRIEVDDCEGCPFSRKRFSEPAGGVFTCRHPAFEKPKRIDTLAPPDWCPLRGAVTLIGGPPLEKGEEG